ncbi:MAG: xanthine dehydrogenase family protein molybdopterin-binding subunit [Chloroflexota bacterium]
MASLVERPFRVIGTRPVRPDGIEKVTGAAHYGADVQLPRMLFARLKKSPHAHAIIKSIDVSKALALPGVEAVVIGKDFPDWDEAVTAPGATPRRFFIGNFMAVDKVLFHGHAVAAVAATSIHVAEDAIELIEVEYEVLPPVMTAEQATAPGAAILHHDLRTAEPTGGAATDEPSNVASHLHVSMGDVDAAFATADIVVEGDFGTNTYHQGYIEPHAAVAAWSPDGSLVIYSSSQGIFGAVREPLAQALKIPSSKIRVVPMEIGGGFGGKNRTYCEPVAAMLARKSGKPVKLVMTREDVLLATGPTAGTSIHGKMGATKEGKFIAAELTMYYEAGAFPGSSVGGGVNHAFGNYDIDNVRIDGYDVVVNRPRNAAYRAPGVPAPTFVCESLVDEIAERLDMDSMDLRLMNASKEGDRRPNGMVLPISGNMPVMEAMKDTAHYRSELTGKNRGRGVAVGFWHANTGQHSINANVNSDGTITLNAAAMDIGGLRATEAMAMAEALGVPYEDVHPMYVDTQSIGFTGNTGGSGTGAGTAGSVLKAAGQIKEELILRAARLWEIDASQVSYDSRDGSVSGPAGSDGKPRTMTFKQLATRLQGSGGPVSGHADNEGGTRAPTYAGHIVDVEVDTDTGKVTILRYTTVTDVGTAMHPSYVEGQIQGGAVQGVGMALTEEYFYDDNGILRNSSLLDYRMPTALDVPMIDAVLLEVQNPNHPLGVRGVGEIPLVPPMGAIANAIYHAVGVRPRVLPASPRVLLADILDAKRNA